MHLVAVQITIRREISIVGRINKGVSRGSNSGRINNRRTYRIKRITAAVIKTDNSALAMMHGEFALAVAKANQSLANEKLPHTCAACVSYVVNFFAKGEAIIARRALKEGTTAQFPSAVDFARSRGACKDT